MTYMDGQVFYFATHFRYKLAEIPPALLFRHTFVPKSKTMNNKTYYHLILDRSGSMAESWDVTLRAYKAQINAICRTASRFTDQQVMFSTCVFNQRLEFPGGIVPVGRGELPSIHHISPAGNTALLDAIGESIHRIEFTAAAELEARQASVVVVVLTDGHENASTRFDAAAIQREMSRTRETGLWSFTFIGADFDVTEMAERFNVGLQSRKNINKHQMPEFFQSTGRSMDVYLNRKRSGMISKDFL